ncbi:MAG: EamA family transporter [Candidatus Micrarchaeia archaeon]
MIIIGLGFILALATMFFWGINEVLFKPVTGLFGPLTSSLFVGVMLIPSIIYLLLFPPLQITLLLVILTLASGILYVFGFFLIFKSLETEQASETWGLGSLPYLSAILFAIFVLNESINVFQAVSIILILLGALMISLNKNIEFNKKLFSALMGNIFWMLSMLFYIYTLSLYPLSSSIVLFLSLAFGFATVFLYGSFYHKFDKNIILSVKKDTKHVVLLIIAWLFEGIGQITFLLVVLMKYIAIGSAIMALDPILVLIISYIVYKERITLLQGIGIIVAVSGAIILSLI